MQRKLDEKGMFKNNALSCSRKYQTFLARWKPFLKTSYTIRTKTEGTLNFMSPWKVLRKKNPCTGLTLRSANYLAESGAPRDSA